MTALLASVLSFLFVYKYIALFLSVFLIAVIVPLPTNVILLATGAFSSFGYFNFPISLAVALTAAVGGDLVDYALAYRYGPKVFKWLRVDKHHSFERLRDGVRKHAPLTIFLTRFVGPLDQIVSLFAGSIRIPFRIFIVYDFLGNFATTLIVLYVGYITGVYWQMYSGLVDTIGSVLLVAIVLFLIARVFVKHERGKDRFN